MSVLLGVVQHCQRSTVPQKDALLKYDFPARWLASSIYAVIVRS